MKPFALALLLGALQESPVLAPGLVGEYFDIGQEIDDFPSLKDRKPALRKIDAQVNFELSDGKNFAGTNLKNYFCVRWTGILRMAEEETVVFGLYSDDGSRLLLDGKLVVDHGGIHDMREPMKGKPLKLAAGNHEIRIDFFQNDRGVGCKACWEKDGGFVPIPASAFLHRKDR